MKFLAIIALAAACAVSAHAREPRFYIDPSIFYRDTRNDDRYRNLEQERQLQRIEEQNERIERLLEAANDARLIDSH